jgi:hypothetical protein
MKYFAIVRGNENFQPDAVQMEARIILMDNYVLLINNCDCNVG